MNSLGVRAGDFRPAQLRKRKARRIKRSRILWAGLVAISILGMAFQSQAKAPSVGFIIDREAGLTWIADGRYAVTSGMSREAVMERARARGFISALNSGKVRNFGYNDWRLPSQAELRSLADSPARDTAIRGLGELRDYLASLDGGKGISPRVANKISDPVFPWPVRGQTEIDDIADVVLFATNSMHLKDNATVNSGDLVANDASPGPTQGCSGREMCVGTRVTTSAASKINADSIQIKKNSDVLGEVFCNDLTNNGNDPSLSCGLINLPVFPVLPPFIEQAPQAGAPDIFVPQNESTVLEPGDYGVIDVNKNGVVRFTGGIYNVQEIDFGQFTSMLFDAPSEVRVEEKFKIDKNSTIGSDQGVTASEIIFYVAGINGNNGNLGASPRAAKLGVGVTADANFHVPNGTLWMRQNSVSTGAFLARDLILGDGATANLDSAFVSSNEPPPPEPPTADPQAVSTNGGADLEITLTGSDPEAGDLTFSIETAPSQGTLSTPSPIIETVPEIDRVTGLPTGNETQLPITKASLTYTPDTPDNLEDSFTFKVTDPTGLIGTAVVDINLADNSPPPPPVTEVNAEDAQTDATTNVATEITLQAGAPEQTAELTFSVESLPSGALTDSLGNSIDTVPFDLPDATVIYTSPLDFTGTDSFQFQARDASVTPPCGAPSCSTATVTIEVQEQILLAEDSQVTTNRNESATAVLGGNRGGSVDGTYSELDRRTIVLGAEVAGRVSDSDDDGQGDANDDLPGASPELGAAGVDVDDGNIQGVVRFQAEWDVRALPPFSEQIQSAEVALTTEVGENDALDTTFFINCAFSQGEPCSNFDGILSESDFQSDFFPFSNIVMPVPEEAQVGDEGTFQFTVSASGFQEFIAIQGRVNENLAGQGHQSGLQVRTSAVGNRLEGKDPKLTVVLVPGESFSLIFTVQSLPQNGTLTNPANGEAVAVGDTFIGETDLLYSPNLNFAGSDSFTYQVKEGLLAGTAQVNITVNATDNCLQNGRPVGCSPGQ